MIVFRYLTNFIFLAWLEWTNLFDDYGVFLAPFFVERNFKVRVAYFPEKWIILKKKIFFHRNQREIVIVCHSFAKVFDLRFKN